MNAQNLIDNFIKAAIIILGLVLLMLAADWWLG